LVTPRLLESEEIEKTPLEVSRSTREFLKDSMKYAVKTGTAITLSKLVDYEIYAKTGTAQTSSLALQEKTNKYLEHAWFVTYFRYKNQQPLTMVVLVEQTGSSSTATSVARKLLIANRKLQESLSAMAV
jgi:cell division protein FtsI/penicillin-binding protein 2